MSRMALKIDDARKAHYRRVYRVLTFATYIVIVGTLTVFVSPKHHYLPHSEVWGWTFIVSGVLVGLSAITPRVWINSLAGSWVFALSLIRAYAILVTFIDGRFFKKYPADYEDILRYTLGISFTQHIFIAVLTAWAWRVSVVPTAVVEREVNLGRIE